MSDLLEGTDVSENTPPTETPPDHQAGPPDDGLPLADWVPADMRAPEAREELLRSVGLDPNKLGDGPKERPEYLPEKFWEDGKGPRLEQMAKSYAELERTLSSKGKSPPPEAYEVNLPEGVEADADQPVLSDNDVELFKELGLSNEGAQKLVNHFWEQVIPMVAEQQGEVEKTKLASEWQMDTNKPEFKQRLGSIKQWAEQNLPHDAVASLRGSANGIKALWAMMNNNRPIGDSAPANRVSKDEIQQRVNDPRYWDEANPQFRRETEEMAARLGA